TTMAASTTIPFFPYKLFFLYVEPISALAGAFYAIFRPDAYLNDLVAPYFTPLPPVVTSTPVYMSLYQLGNLYLLFALNEYLVLSNATSITTWRRLLFGLLVADIGHLITMAPVGSEVFWQAQRWNAMGWGSVPFVYLGATMRACFLLGVGLNG
ncbi:hypothetical protein K488DRAFT_37885, partial [Vararia minispora EC-137]